MKIAVPTMDGTSISAHFGRSKGFLVFEFEGGAIRSRELRDNAQHKGHEQDHACHGHGHDRHAIHDPQQGGGHHHQHDHRGFATLLADCQAVIVRGMGAGAAQAMRAAGIRVCLIQEDCTPEEAVSAFASGRLMPQEGSFCGCHGH